MNSSGFRTLVICLTLVATIPCSAANSDNQFIQVESDNDSEIFDLNTVKFLLPGRFIINSTRVDRPDVMRFETGVLVALEGYCGGPDGQYKPSPALLTLGAPDMPVRDIEVSSHRDVLGGQEVEWRYPYKRLAWVTSGGPVEDWKIFFCGGPTGEKTTSERFLSDLAVITNGTRLRTIIDCGRAMYGAGILPDQDLSTVILLNVRKGSELERTIDLVCVRVTGTVPVEQHH